MLDLSRWIGKTALVTGASSGIGRATAIALAARGMRVALVARRAERLQALCGELTSRGSQALAVPADVRDEAQIKSMFATVNDAWGGVDVYVASAGLGWYSPIAEGETRNWREMIDLNIMGFALGLREAVSHMRTRNPAQIVAISSMAAYRVPAGRQSVFYAATKHAMRALVEGLRMELVEAGNTMKLGMISPGMVDTEFQAKGHHLLERGEAFEYPMRVLDSEDIADAVMFLLAAPPQVQVQDIQMRSIHQIA